VSYTRGMGAIAQTDAACQASSGYNPSAWFNWPWSQGSYLSCMATAQAEGNFYTPAVATALSPGLPVGYDPNTGIITGNVTGALQPTDLAGATGASMDTSTLGSIFGSLTSPNTLLLIGAVAFGLLILFDKK
jgi:hypothetical protein